MESANFGLSAATEGKSATTADSVICATQTGLIRSCYGLCQYRFGGCQQIALAMHVCISSLTRRLLLCCMWGKPAAVTSVGRAYTLAKITLLATKIYIIAIGLGLRSMWRFGGIPQLREIPARVGIEINFEVAIAVQ